MLWVIFTTKLISISIWPAGLQRAYYYYHCDTTDDCKPALRVGDFICFYFR